MRNPRKLAGLLLCAVLLTGVGVAVTRAQNTSADCPTTTIDPPCPFSGTAGAATTSRLTLSPIVTASASSTSTRTALPRSTTAATPTSTTTGPPTATPTAQAPAHGALIWSDDFDGVAGALPDATKWTEEYGAAAYRNNELQCYTNNNPSNASLDGHGALRITVRREPNSCGKEYTSASVWTKDKFDFLYGYVEARIKTPSGSGLWPAFWTEGSTGSWPDHGELDVMERVNSDPGSKETTHGGPLHWTQYQLSSVPPAGSGVAYIRREGQHRHGRVLP
jgi:beta-glucanase (GH16 family)